MIAPAVFDFLSWSHDSNTPSLNHRLLLPDPLNPLYLPYTTHLLPPLPLIPISTLNREIFSDVSWTLSMYLEAVAMLPQIYMFQKQASDQGGIVEVK